MTAPPGGGRTKGDDRRMDRFDGFTNLARKVLTEAQREAHLLDHDYIGTEHLLLGLVAVRDGVAAITLQQLGVELEQVRTAVAFIIGKGDAVVHGEVGLTPRAKRVIELAIDEARRLDHRYIGTEHLLLGLVREGEGIGAGVLESMGVNLDKARYTVIALLKASDSIPRSDAAGPPAEPVMPSSAPDRPYARFDDWTADLRGALIDATEIAASEGAPEIGTDHLLLGLVAAPAGAATTLLAILGVERSTLQGSVAGARDAGTDAWSHGMPAEPRPEARPAGTRATDLSPQARMALTMAEGEARRQGAAAVAAGHLLIGLALLPTTIAGRALDKLHVDLPRLRGAMAQT